MVTIGTTTLAAWGLAQLHACCWPLPTLVPFAESHPVLWGLLLGTGYIVGELPNSFAKRQFGISPGAAGQGAAGRAFWVVDQLDSLAGMLLFIAPVWRPSLAIARSDRRDHAGRPSGERLDHGAVRAQGSRRVNGKRRPSQTSRPAGRSR